MSGPALDLRAHPFLQPDSRLVLRRSIDGATLQLGLALYERRLERSLLTEELVLLDESGADVTAGAVATPAAVRFPGGASIVPVGADALSVALPPGAGLRCRLPGRPEPTGAAGDGGREGAGRAASPVEGIGLAWRLAGGEAATGGAGGRDLVVGAGPHGARLLLAAIALEPGRPGPAAELGLAAGPPDAPAHETARAIAEASWSAWFACRPAVPAGLEEAADLAWWVLRANRIRLATAPDGPGLVAPSKLGYVAAWQWDSYFIALGLRHGDPEAAWEQIAFFLDRAAPDGQLPDLVSDRGALHRVADLPEEERGDDDPATAVTKPPLAAWAAWAVAERLGRERGAVARREALAWAAPRLATLARWWETRSDLDGDGLSEYAHRFSSGLDDSPLFDGGVPAESPDLNAYLAVADDGRARIAELLGESVEAARLRAAAAARVERLVARRWDPVRGRFRSLARGVEADVLTPFGLMPLLTGRLPAPVVERAVATLVEPGRLWTPWPLATVAADEPTFDRDRMWRGPVWLNVNHLLASGLRASGRPEIARSLVERSLELVARHGPWEHWDPLDGRPAASATSAFGWSAALFIDLAAELAAGGAA